MTTADATAIDGLYNFRDTGGTPLSTGGTTRSGALFRSESLASITDEGLAQLAVCGIGIVVDLRTESERTMAPDRRPAPPGFRAVELPLLEGAMSGWAQAARAMRTADEGAIRDALGDVPTLGDLYVSMLQGGADVFAETARLVAVPGEGEPGVLVHCTAGKDRTGVATALMLDLVGADRDAVIDDYASSQARLAGPWADAMMDSLARMGVPRTPEVARLVIGTPHEAIERALAWVEAQGGTATYLRSGGLTDAEMDALGARLVG